MPDQAGQASQVPHQPPCDARAWRSGADAVGPLREGLRRWVAALAVTTLAACSPSPHPPLMVGMNAWVGYDPLVLARDKKLLDPRQVKVVELDSTSDTQRHFRNGLLDAAALTLDEALRLADEGIDVRVVAVMDASNGADVVMADPGIQTLSDLRGASIAVEGTTVGAVVLQRLLQKAGLKPADVSVVHLEAPQQLEALRHHRVSAAVSYEPVASALRAAGFQNIFDSRQMQGEIVDVLVVRTDLLVDRAAQVDALLAAWHSGMQALHDDPGAAAALLAPGTDLTADQYLAALKSLKMFTPEQSLAQLSGSPPPLVQNAQSMVAALRSMDLIAKVPDWPVLIAPEPAQRLRSQEGQP